MYVRAYVCVCVCRVCVLCRCVCTGFKSEGGKENLSVTYYGILGTFLILNVILTIAL